MNITIFKGHIIQDDYNNDMELLIKGVCPNCGNKINEHLHYDPNTGLFENTPWICRKCDKYFYIGGANKNIVISVSDAVKTQRNQWQEILKSQERTVRCECVFEGEKFYVDYFGDGTK
jgi:uncharacterized protein with PIN domain